MSISGRHRSPLLREIPDLPKDFYSFQSAAQPGSALFCSSSFEVIYQLYPTANVFCAIDISVYKIAISSLFHTLYTTLYRQFRNKLQYYCNFRGSATLSRPVSMQSIQLCRLNIFSLQVYSFRQCRQIAANHESNICSFFVRITSIYIFLFPIPFVIIFVYNEPCAERPARCFLIY